MELRAPSKVNWHLAVGRRRPDGYHPIASIFQTCSLCDVIDVTVLEGPFSVEVEGLEDLCRKGSSTLDKAALLWHEETGFDKTLRIRVDKRIPSQAGLGGGSSDAASLLLYLNSISETPMETANLMRLGARVGCDVPFFICGCRAAVGSGLGEIVRPIRAREDLRGFIIVTEGQKTSTREAYEALDGRLFIPELDDLDSLEQEYYLPVSEWSFRNDFDLVNSIPELELEEGERLLLTGSGSCHVLLSDRSELPLSDKCKALKVSF